jgi:ABC-2 type transport system ATP-binding protein
MSKTNPAIDVVELTKRYGSTEQGVLAVDSVTFQVERGRVFGFLGPNGAGKTTTIRMLTGLARPTAGRASVLGMAIVDDMPRIKRRIGVVPETSNLYGELTAFDNLIFSMRLYGVPRQERARRADALLERFRLADKRNSPFAHLSRGMKRALTVAAALAHRPEVVFLDEPTTGLDVASARRLRQIIAELCEQDVTVFLTTHYLEEAERLCDRIALLVRGKIVALDTVDGLKAQVQGTTAVALTLESENGGTETQRVVGEDIADTVRSALAQAEVEGRRVLAVNTVRPTLHDAFVQLTGLSSDVMHDKSLGANSGKGK